MTERQAIPAKMKIMCLLFRVWTPCAICEARINVDDEIEWDHVWELSDGGPHTYVNIRPVHAGCHQKKSARSTTQRAHIKRLAAGGKMRKGPKMKSRGFPKVHRPMQSHHRYG